MSEIFLGGIEDVEEEVEQEEEEVVVVVVVVVVVTVGGGRRGGGGGTDGAADFTKGLVPAGNLETRTSLETGEPAAALQGD